MSEISPSPMCDVDAEVVLLEERGSESVWAVGAGRAGWERRLGSSPALPSSCCVPVCPGCHQPQPSGKECNGWSPGAGGKVVLTNMPFDVAHLGSESKHS